MNWVAEGFAWCANRQSRLSTKAFASIRDLVVEDKLIVEVKSVENLAPVHKKQLLTYLRLADKRLGLLINFHVVLIKDGIARVVNGLEDDYHAKSPSRQDNPGEPGAFRLMAESWRARASYIRAASSRLWVRVDGLWKKAELDGASRSPARSVKRHRFLPNAPG
jgi:PD-(D/E)XK nuclease superfamily